MSDHSVVMAIHAAISRRNWHEMEQAANKLRDYEQPKWRAAADRIEALETALQDANAAYDHGFRAGTAMRTDRIETLEAALRMIADIGEGSTTANSLPNVARIARAALAPEQDK